MLVFADEVGFLMNPCVKATWAPVRCTPVVQYHKRHHRKVSALGALALTAAANRSTSSSSSSSLSLSSSSSIELLIDWHPDSYVRAEQAADFVRRLLKHIPAGPITLIWDKLQAHRSRLVKELVRANPRLTIHYLPSYAPDLNPVETLWSLTKHHRMANHTLDTLDGLIREAKRHVRDVAREPALLRACFRSAGLILAPSQPSAQ